jgi:hydrophobic/amphiphilic exporter-1 (mainly G- bacteria), HAE1 family
MALKMGTGSEAYAPLAKAIIGGLSVSVVLTVFLVPAAFLMVYRQREKRSQDGDLPDAHKDQPIEEVEHVS